MRTMAFRAGVWLPAALACALVAGCPDDTTPAADTLVADTFVADTVAPDTGPPGDSLAPEDTAEPLDTSPGDTVAADTASPDTAGPDTASPDTTPADVWVAPRCGDGHVDFGEACDLGDALNSDTLPDHCRTDCTDPRCGDGVPDSGEPCDDGDGDDYDGCTALCALGPVVPPPTPGDVVITELMINPDAVPDARGEWIELYNASGHLLNLGGCVVADDGTDAFTFTGPGGGVLLPQGAFMVLARDADEADNGGVSVDYVYATMLLDNTADEVVLRCSEAEVDRVAWTALDWLLISGQSASLDPTRLSALHNDATGSWCSGVVAFGDGDLGTPGSDNPPCFQLDTTVDACVLTMAADAVGYTDSPLLATVEVAEFGVTDLTRGVDLSPNLIVELGHGPLGSQPAAGGWTWFAAEPAPDWEGPGPLHFDGYQRALSFATPSTRDAAARASRDGGASWSYCDRGVGAADGFDTTLAGHLTILQSPCQPSSCVTPGPAACAADGIRLQTADPAGACVPTSASLFDCVYTPVVVDCGATGQICEDGACGAFAGAPSAEGDLVVTELLIAPSAVARGVGQWVEVNNASDRPLDLDGCALTVTPGGANPTVLTWTVPQPFVVGAGARAVLGASTDPIVNGAAPVALAWDAAFALPTGSFTLALSCGAVAVDVVPYGTGTGWPTTAGAAVSLSPYHHEAAGNDLPASWCLATATFGRGDRGTPGADNADCPGDVVAVDSCWLLGAALDLAPAGVPATLTARVIEPPITTKTTRTDANPKLVVEIGVGPAGARPGDATWVWHATAPDTAWIASSALGFNLGEDRYRLTVSAPAPGLWDVLARITADGGNTWALCDLNALVPAGEAPTPKQLQSEPGACFPDPCGAAPGHVCKAPVAGSARPPTIILDRHGPAVCTLDADEAAACAWVDDVVTDCATLGAECQGGACANFPVTPGPGDAVISELMIIPATSELGEWLEISNVGAAPLTLAGCVLRSGPNESWTWPVPATLTDGVLAPGAAAVLARSGSSAVNGGAAPRVVTAGVALSNTADWVSLECEGEVVDLVAWNLEDDWQIPVGHALALAGNRLDPVNNDFVGAWCEVATASPNALNPLCPPPDTVLDDCVALDPGSAAGEAGVPLALSGRLLDRGVTDVRPGPDLAPGTVGQVGFGPVGSDPTGPGWTWAAAAPDATWRDDSGTGYDAWTGALTALAPGDYAAALRFSADSGATWLYCDTDGGPFAPGNAIPVAIAPGVCVPNPCTAPPANGCSGNNLVGRVGLGTCTVDEISGEAGCSYTTLQFSCALYGGCNATTGDCGQPLLTPSASGDLIINEIMRDSLVTAPDKGEWVELRSTRAVALDLRGCVLSDEAGRSTAIAGPVPVTVAANGYYLLATSKTTADNGGLANVGWAWGEAFGLANTGQTLVLTCGGVEIDRVVYAWDWPSRTGYTMQLHNGATAVQNDTKAWWCEASAAYGGGNRGTPRAANKVCAGVPTL